MCMSACVMHEYVSEGFVLCFFVFPLVFLFCFSFLFFAFTSAVLCVSAARVCELCASAVRVRECCALCVCVRHA